MTDERMPIGGTQDEKDALQHPLTSVFLDVVAQVRTGKGGRHGGDTIPFRRQPWVRLADVHGVGFLTGQAAKKLEEAVTTKRGADVEAELLGAIAYLGMAVLYLRDQESIQEADREHLLETVGPLDLEDPALPPPHCRNFLRR